MKPLALTFILISGIAAATVRNFMKNGVQGSIFRPPTVAADITSLNVKTVSLYNEIVAKQKNMDDRFSTIEQQFIANRESVKAVEEEIVTYSEALKGTRCISLRNILKYDRVSEATMDSLRENVTAVDRKVLEGTTNIIKMMEARKVIVEGAVKNIVTKLETVFTKHNEISSELKRLEDELRSKMDMESMNSTDRVQKELGDFRLVMARDSAKSRFNDGEWVVIQKRGQFGNPSDFFARPMEEYVNGFGDPSREFWIGLDKMSLLTRYGAKLRIQLESWKDEVAEAEYSDFKVGSGPDFTLDVSGYSGNAGDCFKIDNGMKFTAMDNDADKWNGQCSHSRGNGGWWFNACGLGNLNGLNVQEDSYSGIMWYMHSMSNKPFKSSLMMVKKK